MRVEELLSRLEAVKQTRRGAADWMARCPAHRDGRPSLHVSLGRNRDVVLHCFAGCSPAAIVGVLGLDLKDLFADGVTTDWRDQRLPPKPTYSKPAPPPSRISPGARAWLEGREIDPGLAELLGVTGDDRSLAFPFWRNGEHINTQTRFITTKDFRMEAGCEVTWFGLDDAMEALNADDSSLVICEGMIDWLSIKQTGRFGAVVSMPNGASNLDMPFFADLDQHLATAKRVIVAVDADDPGQRLEAELVRRLGPELCQRVRWPSGCNDANDVLVTHGNDVLTDCLAKAEDIPVEGILSPDDLSSEYEFLYDNGLQRGLTTGFASMDPYFTVLPRYLTLVTGPPGSGKSEWLDAVMINMAIWHNWRFVVFSPESAPPEEHLARWAAKYIDKPFFKGVTPRMTREEAIFARRWANDHVRFIAPEEPTTDELLRLFGVEVRRWGANAFVVDPFNEVMDPEAMTMRDDKYLSSTIRKYRQFAEGRGVHGFIVNHPHAVQKDKDTGQYPVIDLYDLHGGSMWSNKVAAMISLWRDRQDATQPVKAYVKKAKTLRIGKLGRVNFTYDRVTGRYHETGETEDGG